MKVRDRQRLRPLDQASVPFAWPEIERRATEVAGNSRIVRFATDDETSPRKRITAAVVGLALGGASLLLAFNVFRSLNDSTPASPPGIFFATLKEPTNMYPAAFTSGTIAESNGCIVLHHAGETDDLLIWPNGTRLVRAESGNLRILGSDGSFIAEVGGEVVLGGGNVVEPGEDIRFAEQLIGESIPARCRVDGSYFMTSGEASPVSPSVSP
jgi:hypothetical protein